MCIILVVSQNQPDEFTNILKSIRFYFIIYLEISLFARSFARIVRFYYELRDVSCFADSFVRIVKFNENIIVIHRV